MKTKTIKLLSAIVISCVLATQLFSLAAGVADINEEELTAEGAIVIDFKTNQEIYAYNADQLRPPASMTKVMTVYLVYEAIASGKISLDTHVPVSEEAFLLAEVDGLTNIPLSEEEIYTVDELLDAAIVNSACGATLALAELVGGSNESFIGMMNSKAEEWGIDAVFYDTYGIAPENRETLVTVRAMAEIVRNSILEYPEILHKTAKQTVEIKGIEYNNTNRLLGEYRGLDGFKTGYTNKAGACFAATAIRGDTRLITVVMGSSGNTGRFGDTQILLDYGFMMADEIRNAENPPPTRVPTSTPRPSPTPVQTPVYLDDTDNPADESEDELSGDRSSGAFWFFVFILIIMAGLFITALVTSYIR